MSKITIDKAVLEQALDALSGTDAFRVGMATTIIREALREAQPAAQPTEPAYTEAVSLATALFKKHFAHEEHYASGRIVWGPCDTTAGVISQIDNMVSGLIQPTTQQAPAGEPVGWINAQALEELRKPEMTWMPAWNRQNCTNPVAIYTRPAVPLSDEQIAEITVDFYGSAIHEDDYGFARAIEAAHKIGGAE
jgi:hypothetical protein